jgi:hypothetical protein
MTACHGLARFEEIIAYSRHGQMAPSKYDVICMSEDILQVKGTEDDPICLLR